MIKKIESKEGFGSLCDSQIQTLTKQKLFTKETLKYISVGPASVDISSTFEMYRIEKNVIPNPNQTIRELLGHMDATLHNIKNPLERDVQYICCVGKISLPEKLYAFGNAKSSSGRVDLHVRLMADYTHAYDTITPGEKEFWLHITPHSFPVICPDNTPLLQIRFFNGDGRLLVSEIEELNLQNKIFSYPKHDTASGKHLSWTDYSNIKSKNIILSLNLPEKKMAGWKAKKTSKVLDLSRRDYSPTDFFDPVFSKNGKIDLEKDAFYILSTRETINIPENLAGEMVANHVRLGEFRTHYAGFFDPGFSGEGVLEVRPQENISFWHGQPMVPFRLEKMSANPKKSYKVGHNYYGQKGPKLAKFFRKD
jgi:dCTP deaminase